MQKENGMNALSMYRRFVGVSVRSQMQYRASFVMMALGSMLSAFADYIALWALFNRFGTVQGWTLYEVGLIYGMGHMAFAISEALVRGFDVFQNDVRTGAFDRVLLRPRSTVLQMMGAELQLSRLGRFLQGGIVLVVSVLHIAPAWGVLHYMLLFFSIAGGALLFSAIIVLQATSCFWVIESLEVWNAFSYGGINAVQYPLSIYHKPIRYFFSFILPLAAVSYYPCAFLLGKAYVPLWLSLASPAIGVLLFLLSLLVWQVGVRHYTSTGS